MVGSARKGESEEGEEGVGGENVIIQLQKLGQIIVRCIIFLIGSWRTMTRSPVITLPLELVDKV